MGASKNYSGAMTPDGGGMTDAPKLTRGATGKGAANNQGIDPKGASVEGSSDGNDPRGDVGNNKSGGMGNQGGPSGAGKY